MVNFAQLFLFVCLLLFCRYCPLSCAGLLECVVSKSQMDVSWCCASCVTSL